MIIIGGGPAGYTAALYAVRAGFDTLVLERFSAGGALVVPGDYDVAAYSTGVAPTSQTR